jgi:hypothetical protein
MIASHSKRKHFPICHHDNTEWCKVWMQQQRSSILVGIKAVAAEERFIREKKAGAFPVKRDAILPASS